MISLGNSVAMVGKLDGDEHGVSQLFCAINYKKICPANESEFIIDTAIADLKSSIPSNDKAIIYTGEMTSVIKENNLNIVRKKNER